MAYTLLIDIPVFEEKPGGRAGKVIQRRRLAQDCINLQLGVQKPLQRGRKQFSRGLLSLAAYVRDTGGHRSEYLPNNAPEASLKEGIRRADVVCITGNNTAYFDRVREVASQVKAYRSDVPVLTGGYHVSALDHESLEICPSLDIIVRGEGEIPLLEILNGTPWYRVPGVTYRRNGRLERTALPQPLRPEEIPSPDYSLLPDSLDSYNFNLQGTRGCRYRCRFCSNGYFWRQPRSMPVETLLEEIRYLATALTQGTIIHFSDNIFCDNPARTATIIEGLRRIGPHLRYSCDLKANHTFSDQIRKMEEVGFVKISLGFEDAADTILAKCHKSLSVEDNVRAAETIKSCSGILVEAYWLLGLPGTNRNTMERNLSRVNHLLRTGIVDVVGESTVFTPLPGTPMFHYPENYGIRLFSNHWPDFLRCNFRPVYELENVSRQELEDYFLSF
ncbi:MAG: B12-binding domain-containing radical SAM protein, partial [Verrucomicrobia bacterium]|nr:B12-binding domain-containing radical SAM protein [Verrucomicrobiota bacterium]